MKKNNPLGNYLTEKAPIKHFLLIMRTTIILLLTCVFYSVAESGYTQNARVTIHKRNATLKEVLNEIERQTDYLFIYNNEVNTNTRVSVKVKQQAVSNVLDALLKNKDLGYSLEGNHIILSTTGKTGKAVKELVASGMPQQKRTITGTVMDASGDPIIGANIVEAGTTNGTVSDVDGKFSLNLDDNAIIRISYIGYLERNIDTAGRTSFIITLLEDTHALEEVVVVGYGTQKRVNLTGSVAVVDSRTLLNRPITNSSQALQGVKGLYVNQAGGAQPGADGANITIRGITSIGGASKLKPLILVDGVELSLDNVNPNDIESISVLKDAASTAIYGSRAANGVILVTTKKGQENDLSIIYSGYVGFQEATYLPDPVDNSADFMELYNKAQINQGTAPYYSQELIDEFRQNPTSLIHPNTNWMKLMFGKAPITEHNVRVSSGNNKTKFNLSAGLLNHEGILRKGLSSADRYNLNIRVSSKISDRVNLEGSLMGTIWKIKEPANGISTFMNRLMRMVPLQPIGKLENNNWADSWVVTPGQNSFQSPLVWAEEAYRNVNKYNSTAVLSAKYDIMKGLSFQTMGSFNNEHSLLKNWYPMIQLYDPRNGEPRKAWSGTSTKTHRHDYYEHLNLTNTLYYETIFKNDHSISTLLGTSYEKYSSNYMNSIIQGFPTMDLQELSLGTSNQSVTGNSNTNSLVSYFGRIQYSYQDKYLFEANGRFDGSSKFSKEKRWGFFPSFSLGWRITEEPFARDINWLEELKIRGSWGQIGNQEIGLFQYVNAVNLGYGYPFGGVYNAGAAITQSRDPNIRWETTTISNLGIDWIISKGMLSGEIEVFNKKTSDILRGITLPAQVGALAGPTTNVATVENKGLEIGLTHRKQISNDFSYEVGANFSRIKNKVINLKGERIISGSLITQEGSPINSWYLLKTEGLFKTQEEVDNYPTITSRVGPGDIKYIDLNKDGKIDGNDRYIAGNTFPDFTYGFNLSFDYKRFSLTTLWQGVQNISVRPNFNMASPFNNGAGVTKDWLTDSWTPENPNARLPRISCRNQYTAENFSESDFWLEDASYLRLKNIQLSYRFEGNYLSKFGLKQIVIFANAQNFLTLSKVRHFDPERNITQTNIDQYPTAKTVTFGLNLNF